MIALLALPLEAEEQMEKLRLGEKLGYVPGHMAGHCDISLTTLMSGSEHGLRMNKTRLCPDQSYNNDKLVHLEVCFLICKMSMIIPHRSSTEQYQQP